MGCNRVLVARDSSARRAPFPVHGARHDGCSCRKAVEPFPLRRLIAQGPPLYLTDTPGAIARDPRTDMWRAPAPQDEVLERTKVDDGDALVFELAHRRGRGRRFVNLNLEHVFPDVAPWDVTPALPLYRAWTIVLGMLMALFAFASVAYALAHRAHLFR